MQKGATLLHILNGNSMREKLIREGKKVPSERWFEEEPFIYQTERCRCVYEAKKKTVMDYFTLSHLIVALVRRYCPDPVFVYVSALGFEPKERIPGTKASVNVCT